MNLGTFVAENLKTILTSISSMVGSCAWPVAAMIIFLSLRKPLLRLVQHVNLSRLRVGNLELGFAEGVQRAERTADREQLPDPYEADFRFSYPLRPLVDADPRGAILSTWLTVESALLDLAQEAHIILEPRTGQYGRTVARILRHEGMITSGLLETIDQLARLRNLAVHEQDFAPYRDSVIEYSQVASRVIQQLDLIKEGMQHSSHNRQPD